MPRPQSKRVEVKPLDTELRRVHFTASRRFMEKLEATRFALSHSNPGASDEEILEAGLDLLLAQQDKRKGIVAKPRKEPPPSKSDHIPAHVRREVWVRDEGKCQWKIDGGGVCGSTLRPQLAHRVPRAQGGPPTVDNLRILCAFHNQYEARLDFGDDHMQRYVSRAAKPSRVREPQAVWASAAG